MATTIIRKERRPHYAPDGRLLGHFEDVYYVGDRPPQTTQRQQAAAPRPPARPAVPPGYVAVPKVFYARDLGRYITRHACLKCEQPHAACQCWPPFDPRTEVELASGDAPAPLSTLDEVVKIHQAQGLRPGGTPPLTTLTTETATSSRCTQCGKQACNCPPEPLSTLAEVVSLQRARGMLR
jgi:hypothetical protein